MVVEHSIIRASVDVLGMVVVLNLDQALLIVIIDLEDPQHDLSRKIGEEMETGQWFSGRTLNLKEHGD
jgi:hypothetical protein